jgi:hypothetical protein
VDTFRYNPTIPDNFLWFNLRFALEHCWPPRGAVSFVFDCYGGSVSDRQIIEDSNILDNSMFDSGDSIMAYQHLMAEIQLI